MVVWDDSCKWNLRHNIPMNIDIRLLNVNDFDVQKKNWRKLVDIFLWKKKLKTQLFGHFYRININKKSDSWRGNGEIHMEYVRFQFEFESREVQFKFFSGLIIVLKKIMRQFCENLKWEPNFGHN